MAISMNSARIIRIVIVLACFCAIQACATSKTKTYDENDQTLHQALLAVSNIEVPSAGGSNKNADKAFRNIVGACANVLNKLEYRGDRRRRRLVALAITGAIAGSVAAPAVIANDGSMALAAGLSGLSGATNTSQQLLGEQGYSRAELILARENIVTKLNSYVDQWLSLEGVNESGDPTTGAAKVNAKIGILNGMIVACSMYPLGPTRPSEEVKQLVEDVKAQAEAPE